MHAPIQHSSASADALGTVAGVQAAYDVVARLEKAVQRNGDMLAKFAAVEKEIEDVQSHRKVRYENDTRTVSIASGFSSDSSDSDDDFGLGSICQSRGSGRDVRMKLPA